MRRTTAICSALAVAALFAWSGFTIRRDAAAVEASRQSVSLADLQRKPARDSDSWRLEQFTACDKYIWESDPPHGIDVWVPVYSAALPRQPADRDLRDVLYLIDVKDRSQLEELLQSGALNVKFRTQRNEWTEASLRQLKQQHYPGLAPSNCRILTYGHWEPTADKATGQFVMAGVALAVALVLAVLPTLGRKTMATEEGASSKLMALTH
jgi:hypothetical protein